MATQLGRSAASFSDLVDFADLLSPPGAAITADVEALLGVRDVSRFADRVRDSAGSDRMTVMANAEWWPDLADRLLDSPTLVVIAGHALLASARTHPGQRSTLEESMARRRVAFGLCRVASGHYGYSLEATTLLARLAPQVSDELAYFMTTSPMGHWIARSADRALRLYGNDPAVYRRLRDAAFSTAIDPLNPSRAIFPLVLLRRVALTAAAHDDAEAGRTVAQAFRAIASNSEFAVRWRRFALWVLAEFLQHPDRQSPYCTLADLRATMRGVADDPALFDICSVFKDRESPVEQWVLPGGDLYRFETRGADGAFRWPLDRASTNLVETALEPLLHGSHRPNPWRRIPIKMMRRSHDALRECLIHPGHVRVQSAVDMWRAAGEQAVEAVASSVTDVVTAAAPRSDIHPGVLENAIYIAGVLRSERPAIQLAALTRSSPSAEHRSSAVWSLGDIGAAHALQDSRRATLKKALHDEASAVRRAAIRAIAGAHMTDTAPEVLEMAETDPDYETRRYARWCLLSWERTSLTQPPIDFEATRGGASNARGLADRSRTRRRR